MSQLGEGSYCHLAGRSGASCTLQCPGWPHHREGSGPKASSAETEKAGPGVGLGTQLFLSKLLLIKWTVEHQACRCNLLAKTYLKFLLTEIKYT